MDKPPLSGMALVVITNCRLDIGNAAIDEFTRNGCCGLLYTMRNEDIIESFEKDQLLTVKRMNTLCLSTIAQELSNNCIVLAESDSLNEIEKLLSINGYIILITRFKYSYHSSSAEWRPRQSYKVFDGLELDLSSEPPLVTIQFCQDQTRKDKVESFSFDSIVRYAGSQTLSAKHLIRELKFRLGLASKYGA